MKHQKAGTANILWRKKAIGYLVNSIAAVLGAALLERLEDFPGLQHLSWHFFNGFGFSFFFATALGFAVQRLWCTGTGRWVWIFTTSIFVVGLLGYLSRGTQGPTDYCHRAAAMWNHFTGHDCFTTLRAADCGDLLVYTSTFVRGAAYSLGAFVAEKYFT
jgi:hypothetical protein